MRLAYKTIWVRRIYKSASDRRKMSAIGQKQTSHFCCIASLLRSEYCSHLGFGWKAIVPLHHTFIVAIHNSWGAREAGPGH